MIAELDRRRLYEKEGYSSVFWYCVRKLGLSEDAAAKRIHVARAAKKFEVLYSYLSDGSLTLSGASLLAPHLTEENHRSLLQRALGSSKREIEKLTATLAPKADVAD